MVIGKQTRLMYAGHIVLLLTGAVQTIAEPSRQFGSSAFWIKMLLIASGLLIAYFLARIAGLLSILFWTSIVFLSRWIGYVREW